MPPALQSVQQLSQNAPLLLLLNRATTYTVPQQSYVAGSWDVDPSFSALTFLDTGPVAVTTAVAALPTPGVIGSIFRFNNQTKGWDTFNPLLPPSLNGLQMLNQFDALLVRVTGPLNWLHGPSTVNGSAEATAQLQVALLTELVGPLSAVGADMQRGAELARDHVNAAGGVNGMDLVLIPVDLGAGDAHGATRAVLDANPVSAMIGPLRSSDVRLVFAEIAAPEGIVLISPSATGRDLVDLDQSDLLFRTVLPDGAEGEGLAALLNAAGVEQVTILHEDSEPNAAIADVLLESFTGESTRVGYTPGLQSYAAEVTEVAAEGARALVAIGTADDARVFLPELLALGQFTRFFFVGSLRDDTLFADLADPAFDGSRGVSLPSGAGTLSQTAFDMAYQDAFGEEPGPFAREAYDAVITLAFAAERANSVDATAIRDQLREVANPLGSITTAGAAGIADGLARIRSGEAVNYEGAARRRGLERRRQHHHGARCLAGAGRGHRRSWPRRRAQVSSSKIASRTGRGGHLLHATLDAQR